MEFGIDRASNQRLCGPSECHLVPSSTTGDYSVHNVTGRTGSSRVNDMAYTLTA